MSSQWIPVATVTVNPSRALPCFSLPPIALGLLLAFAPVAEAAPPVIGNCRILPADHIFNTPIDALPKHPSSDTFIRTIRSTPRNLHLDLGTQMDQTKDDFYGIPWQNVRGKSLVWKKLGFDAPWGGQGRTESDCAVKTASGYLSISPCTAANAANPIFPIPDHPIVEGGIPTSSSDEGDHHILAIDQDSCVLWEAYHAFPRTDGGWNVHSTARFDLNSNVLRPDGWTSADAAGFPILPLLLRADEASRGEINHALRFTIQSSKIRNSHVWPARHDTSNGGGSLDKPPMGQLFRLKASYVIPDNFTPQAKAILKALKKYGMYIADGGSDMYITGEPSNRWQSATISQVQSVPHTQFEAVDITPVTKRPGFDPNSGSARTGTPPVDTCAPSGLDTTQSYQLQARHSGKVMDVANGSTLAIQSTANATIASQHWHFESAGNGYFRIVSDKDGKVLGSTGRQAIVLTKANNNSQLWCPQATDNGYYNLVQRNSKAALDVEGSAKTDGARVMVWPKHSGHNQQWKPQKPTGGSGTPVAQRWVNGYYVGYQRDLYPVDRIDFKSLTHLTIGRIEPKADGGLLTTFDIDPVEGPRFAKDLAKRTKAAGKKVILMIGGAGTHEQWVSAADPSRLNGFVTNLLKAMDEYGADGLDLDWEPLEVADQAAFKALAQKLRSSRPAMLLTVPIGWISRNFPDEARPYFAEIAPLFDQMNIMSYDMASGFWGWDTWHFAALYGDTPNTPSSIDVSISNYLRIGVPANKLGVGIGFYGSCWRRVYEPHQKVLPGKPGELPVNGDSDNAMSYTNIMAHYAKSATRKWDATARMSYLTSPSPFGPQQCNFVSFEDERSIAEKGAYAKAKKLGGTIIWTINQGHQPGNPAGMRDPLLSATRKAFLE
ncbi:glycosyl hydrolase family 18 protein [Chitinivorax sp. B]|uniref:glycosyl hydrolase family 18 protein n=1 Tax=Chitinivorax sp. B TaxID=2502235 RepID=UPI0010F84546|nr:glycosyl hydrolase family 18 protein [Chitinivorax sp. B]